MRWGATWLAALALPALVDGCGAVTPQDAVMRGDASGVVINYVGDLNQTVSLAQQYCARFERVPVLHETREGNAYYFCVPPSQTPH
jgi:hypothetical protein